MAEGPSAHQDARRDHLRLAGGIRHLADRLGSGQDFVLVYSQLAYGIPPEQVVGSAGVTKYGYDRASKVGTFTQALYDEARKQGWTVISMKNDWKRIFAFPE